MSEGNGNGNRPSGWHLCSQADTLSRIERATARLEERSEAVDIRLLPEIGGLRRDVGALADVVGDARRDVNKLAADVGLLDVEVRSTGVKIGALASDLANLRVIVNPSDRPPARLEDEPTLTGIERNPKWKRDYEAARKAELELDKLAIEREKNAIELRKARFGLWIAIISGVCAVLAAVLVALLKR